VKRNDTLKLKILQLISMVGEISADEIISFFEHAPYTKKQLSILKKDKLIRKYKGDDETTFRITAKAKKELEGYVPKLYKEMVCGPKSVNLLKGEKRRDLRRKKMIEVFLMLRNKGVNILYDEKILCNKILVTDNTDITDNTMEIDEFYTATEIRYFIPEYKTSIGSRGLGVLISKGKVYVIYSVGENMVWKQEREINFRTTTSEVFSRKLFGTTEETYLMFLGRDEKTLIEIMDRYGSEKKGKIMPTYMLPNMLYASLDEEKDFTMDLLINNNWIIDTLEEVNMKKIKFDEREPNFNGIQIKGKDITYFLFAFRFDIYKVAKAINFSVFGKYDVRIACFEYQKPYLEKFLKGKEHNVQILAIPHERYLKRRAKDE